MLQVVLNQWNVWEAVDYVKQLEQITDLSVILATINGNPEQTSDFFQINLMTMAHALRTLSEHSNPEHLRGWQGFGIRVQGFVSRQNMYWPKQSRFL